MDIVRRSFVFIAAALASTAASAQEALPRLTGQTLYLPIYSHLWFGNYDRKGVPSMHPLSALVSIRNPDAGRPIRVTSARYYDTQGKLLKEYVPAPRAVPPLGAFELFIERNDLGGGSGASFVITWNSEAPAVVPVIEAVHVDVIGNRTLSFVTQARAIAP